MTGSDAKLIFFNKKMGKIFKKAFFKPKTEQNSFKDELYSMTGSDEKRIFQRKMVIILKNAVFNPK